MPFRVSAPGRSPGMVTARLRAQVADTMPGQKPTLVDIETSVDREE